MAYIKVNGKNYGIHKGSRGGRYWIDDNGKKHYLKTPDKKKSPKENNSAKKVQEPKLKRYIAYFYEIDVKTGERVDDFKEWTEAYSEEEAREYFEDEHRYSIAEGRLELDDICEMYD